MQPNPNLPFIYMPLASVLNATGVVSKSTLYRLIREGRFPQPDRLDGGRSRWRSDLVSRWLLEQSAKADAEREARAKAARQKGQDMLRSRMTKDPATATA